MTRTITVTQLGVIDSSLSLSETGKPDGKIAFSGLLKRSAKLEIEHQRLTFTTLGFLGRKVRADAANGNLVGEFQQTGILGRGDAAVNGRRYRLGVSGVLARRYHWVATDGTEVMCFKVGGLLRATGTIKIPDSAVPDDAAALIGLGLIARRALESYSGGGAVAAS